MVALQVILWIIALLSFLVGIFGFFMEWTAMYIIISFAVAIASFIIALIVTSRAEAQGSDSDGKSAVISNSGTKSIGSGSVKLLESHKSSGIGYVIIFAIILPISYFLLNGWTDFANIKGFSYLNIMLMIISAILYFIFAMSYSVVLASDEIFKGYNGVGKTYNEIKKYITNTYAKTGFYESSKRGGLIFSLILIGMAGVATVLDVYFLNFLVTTPILFLSQACPKRTFVPDDDFMKEFLNTYVAKNWYSHVCPYCSALNNGRNWQGSGNKSEHHSVGTDNYTTTRVYETYDTIVEETTHHSDPYVRTDTYYDDYYLCVRCKKKYKISRHSSSRTYI
jgi:hypothetical protein